MTIVKRTLQTAGLAGFYTAFMFASTAQKAFAATADECANLEGGLVGGVDCAIGEDNPANTNILGEGGIFERIVNLLLFLVGAISVIMLIVGGIRYVISSGDQNAVTAAKNTILYAIIGLVISFLAFAAVRFIVGALAPEGAA